MPVLNARRHRSGEIHCIVGVGADATGCSTPEGIGAARSSSSATLPAATCACSTPEGIGAARSRLGPPVRRGGPVVLNARRHRSGEIPRVVLAAMTLGRAQRPKASERRDPPGPDDGGRPGPEVLNARRHRSGEILGLRHRDVSPHAVLNARRHRSGEILTTLSRSRGRWSGAQRPKASERRDHGAARTTSADHARAQRPKASERRDHRGTRRGIQRSDVLNARRHRSGEIMRFARRLPALILECSTPEGIGAARSRPFLRTVAGPSCAQRPKASERRDPRIDAGLPGPRRVLNARRHRSGEILT